MDLILKTGICNIAIGLGLPNMGSSWSIGPDSIDLYTTIHLYFSKTGFRALSTDQINIWIAFGSQSQPVKVVTVLFKVKLYAPNV